MKTQLNTITLCYTLLTRYCFYKHTNMIRLVSAFFLSLTFASFTSATPLLINDIVDSHDNLFYTDWGHWFTGDIDGALSAAGSNPARAVQYAGNSFNFAEFLFAGFNKVSIAATGSVVAHFDTVTGPDGCASADPCFNDGNFRGLPAYALIGIWSSSATEILPFGDWKDVTSGLGLMAIGSGVNLLIPSTASAYLFLAENDGRFADNSGQFDVELAAAPEPGTLGLLFAGILLLIVIHRRKPALSRVVD